MVDINLFDDDASEEEKEPFDENFGEDASGDQDDLNADDLGGDLTLDDDLSGDETGFGDDALLDDEDTIPEFEETAEDDNMDDYAFEDSGAKKSIPWIWIVLGVVVIAAVVFLFVILPSQTPQPVRVQTTRRPTPGRTAAETPTQPQTSGQETEPTKTSTQAPLQPVTGKTANPVSAARAVFEYLIRKGSLGVVIVNGDQYLIQYVSETPGQGDALAKEIQTLLGASSYEISPEDKQTSNGRTMYSGVISCEVPVQEKPRLTAAENPYKTVDQFNQRVAGLVAQSGLQLRSTEPVSGARNSQGKQPSGHVIVEGSRTQALKFLNALNGLPGNWTLSRLQLNPLNNLDASAENVRIGISFMVQIG